MTPYTGPVNITRDGTVINGVALNGCLYIPANNVTIENSKITTGSNCFTALNVPGLGLTVKDTEIDGGNRESGGSGQETYGIFANIGTVTRVNLHGMTEPLNGCHNATVTDSYVHDLFVSSTSHNEDLYCGGTSGGFLTVRHNYLANQNNQTGTITLFGDFAPVTNVTIDDNLLNGGGWTLYGGHDSGKKYGTHDASIHITNNRFMRTPEAGAYWPSGGYWGPIACFDTSSPGNIWSNNVWDDTGTAVPLGPTSQSAGC